MLWTCTYGSSPRMRGTRITGGRSRSVNTVHPRACGELTSARAGIAIRDRFIPAHAGNSSSMICLSKDTTVHPRACGELHLFWMPRMCGFGSSPRMRGTPGFSFSSFDLIRFIPAHAGNSKSYPGTPRSITVHPRACGELRPSRAPSIRYSGSSPRMRGTLNGDYARARLLRFIPAHAGNS